MRSFPEGYPEKLLELIKADGARENRFEVFRICRTGIVNRDAFDSTYQDSFKKEYSSSSGVVNRDVFQRKKIDIGDYSTSCSLSLKPLKRIIKAMYNTTPQQIIAKGITEPCCGLSMETKLSLSKRKCNDSHIDWWIYKDAKPEKYFKEYVLKEGETE